MFNIKVFTTQNKVMKTLTFSRREQFYKHSQNTGTSRGNYPLLS